MDSPLVDFILSILDARKASDILMMDVAHHPSSITDYLIICSGTSSRHVYALSDAVECETKTQFGLHPQISGREQSNWVVLDYGYILLHIFRPEVRLFYDIETLWQEQKGVRTLPLPSFTLSPEERS